MTRAKPEPVERRSHDLHSDQLAKLRGLFPEVVTEGKVDFDKLRATLGDEM
jgi:adenine-specific DNA-methyltransferase